MKTALVIMAAGIGSRFGGGIKQLAAVGPNGEIIMDYSIHDAIEAGFDKIVFIIRHDIEEAFKEAIGDRIEKICAGLGVEIDYAFQALENVPEGFSVPEGRSKPWGTGQAVLACKGIIKEPFAVINSDDFYGRGALDAIAAALPQLGSAQDAAMVGYRLKNTVSPFGTVTRGVCATQDGLLRKVQETYKIRLCPDGLIRDMSGDDEGIVLDPEALVSMNLWGYHPQMLDVMAQYFDDFVHTLTPGDEKRECLLPVMMDALTAQSRVRTRVLQTDEHWFGLTYQDDKPGVVAALRTLHADGTYPPALWK